MEKHGGTLALLFVFVSFFSFISFVFAEEASFQEMLQTVRRAGEEVRALQFQTQRVLGPRLPPDETPIVSTLRFGMRGEEVRALQELLRRDREIYPEGLVTGYFGVLTDNAVKRFQAAQGLEITGIVDSWARAYLRGFSRVAPPFLASQQDVVLNLVISSPEGVPEVQDAILVGVGEVQVTSTVSTSTISTSTSTPTVSSGGSGGGGSPTVQSSGSSGGSGGSSPAPSASSDISEPVATSTTTLVTTSTSVSVATSTVVPLSTSVPVISTSTDLVGSVSESSITVSVASSTVVLDDADNDDDDDDDTDKKAEKKLEKEVKKEEKEARQDEKSRKDAVLEKVKITIEEVTPPTARALEGTSTVSRSSGAFKNLATILHSLSGLLGRMSSFFK